ncbi:MAG: preprotein translocase subunit SecG [Deltaproteobacteria bacterium]|nr:preprotein translocase subunit SecG [Deltaproteobacteria bacterium]
METLLITIHYVLCSFLILVILLQAGKGADIGAVFGGASQTVFGGRGPATFLNKITAFVAAGFIVTSVWLAHIAKAKSGTTIIDKGSQSEKMDIIPDADKPLMDLKKEVNEAAPDKKTGE